MNRILELKQGLGETVDKASAYLAKARAENRSMNTEEIASYDKAKTDILAIRETIRVEEADAQVQRDVNSTRERRAAEGGVDVDLDRAAFRKWICRGLGFMNEEERGRMIKPLEMYSAAEIRSANVPQSDVTGNLGQYTVPQSFYAEVITALKYYSGMLQSGATMITMADGRPLPIPTSNDTTQTGIELSENTAVSSPTEVPFGQVTLNAYKYTTRLILVPLELLQDSGVDIEAYIVKMLGIRLGRILNTRFTTGTGTTMPRGITLDAVLGRTSTTGKTQLPQYNDVVALKYSVDRAYRQNGQWMMSDSTWLTMLELVDSNGRPLVLNYATALVEDAPEMLLGQKVIINNDMAGPGTNGSPVVGNIDVLYGDFANYWIRTVSELMMLRLVERYAEYGQVGFIGFARYDGKLVDAGTNPVKYMQCPTT